MNFFNHALDYFQNDVISVEDIDKVLTHGLGCRYAFMGPFETIHLNAEGKKMMTILQEQLKLATK